jgi:hypothetical protein
MDEAITVLVRGRMVGLVQNHGAGVSETQTYIALARRSTPA